MPEFGALDNSTAGDFNRLDFYKVVESQGFLCFWCGDSICSGSGDSNREAVPDHLLPRSCGGSDFLWNIVAACAECNRLRGNTLPGQFLRERWCFAQLVGKHPQKSTRIPFSKKRVAPLPIDEAEENYDDDGNFIDAHLVVAKPLAQLVTELSRLRRMEPSELERRRTFLQQQVANLTRLRLENLGQMVLQFDRPKPMVSDHEAAALSLRGMAVLETLRRTGQVPTHEQILESRKKA